MESTWTILKSANSQYVPRALLKLLLHGYSCVGHPGGLGFKGID
ncbi:MAG: hypothetical protein P4L55_09710 [Syntrophobacteraceae bacterium]|nr:hypothetical protein [Syntrophobacteraceae bacterium]